MTNNVSNPEREASLPEWEPVYPTNLLTSRRIHLFIPHMPLARTDSGNWTLPIGELAFDEEPALVGLLVHQSSANRERFDLKILLNEGADYPRSLNWGFERPNGIAGFKVHRDNPVFADSVEAYTEAGTLSVLRIEDVLSLRGLFLQSIEKAQTRFTNYKESLTVVL